MILDLEFNFLPPSLPVDQVMLLKYMAAIFSMSKKKKIWGSWKRNRDCGPLSQRRLLLGRKVMTNLDSILKSRDITLPTKVPLVKAMVIPVVMYGCESWTVKKAER